jgi:hypothetical protein
MNFISWVGRTWSRGSGGAKEFITQRDSFGEGMTPAAETPLFLGLVSINRLMITHKNQMSFDIMIMKYEVAVIINYIIKLQK